jgi:pilus assembly protein Flp/PilA
MSLLKGCGPGWQKLSARDDRGATAVEYGLMASLIAAVIAVAVGAFGAAVVALFDQTVALMP